MNRIAFLLIAVCAAQAQAQHCGFAFRGYGHNTYAAPFVTTYNGHNKAVAYAAPVVVVPDISYAPSVALQLASVKTNYVRTDADYNAFLQFKAFEAGMAASNAQRLQYAAPQQQQQYAPQQLAQGQPGAAGASVVVPPNSGPTAPGVAQPRVLGIVQHCGRCHGAQLETPKGTPPLYIDPTKQLADGDIIRIIEVLRLPESDPNVMPPPPAKLSAEEKGGILEELLSLRIGRQSQ